MGVGDNFFFLGPLGVLWGFHLAVYSLWAFFSIPSRKCAFLYIFDFPLGPLGGFLGHRCILAFPFGDYSFLPSST